MTDWSIYSQQQAPRAVTAKALSASVIELPFGRRRERFMRALATAVTALAACVGVLVVAAAALMLGLS
jgi:hypothetical protein